MRCHQISRKRFEQRLHLVEGRPQAIKPSFLVVTVENHGHSSVNGAHQFVRLIREQNVATIRPNVVRRFVIRLLVEKVQPDLGFPELENRPYSVAHETGIAPLLRLGQLVLLI